MKLRNEMKRPENNKKTGLGHTTNFDLGTQLQKKRKVFKSVLMLSYGWKKERRRCLDVND